MTHDGDRPVEPWCPSCHTTVGDAATCPGCGLAGQDRPEAAELRVVVARLHAAAQEQVALDQELTGLRLRRHDLLRDLRAERAPGSTDRVAAGRGDRVEWRPERVRDVLLWLGAVLMVIAAITFAAVAWTRLGPAGRAAILLGVTIGAAALTGFVRRRLRPTAEALAAITIGLALVDWGVAGGTALRGDLSGAAWWAVGLLLVAVVGAAVADRIDLDAPRVAAAALAPLAAVFALAAWRPGPAVAVIVLAGITTGVVLVRGTRRDGWARIRPWLSVLVVTGEAAVVVGAIANAADQWGGPQHALAALAVAAIAAAPVTAASVAAPDRRDPALAAATATLAVLGAGVVLMSGTLTTPWLLAGLAVATVAVVLGARLIPAGAREGVVGAAALAAVVPAIATGPNVVAAWARPLGWLGTPWEGSLDLGVAGNLGPSSSAALHDVGATFVILGSLATLALLGTVGRRAADRLVGPGGIAALGLAVALAAADVTIATALAVTLFVVALTVAAAVVADRRAPGSPLPLAILVLAGVAAVPGVGWAAVAPRGSVLTLGTVIGLGAAGAIAFRATALRAGAAVAAAGALLGGIAVVLTDRDVGSLTTAFVVVAVGVAMLVAGRLVHWSTPAAPVGTALEAVGSLGALVGIAAIGDAPSWRLLAFALATVGLVLAARRDDHSATGYTIAAVVGAALTGIAGLVPGRVAAEWITLPAAAVATVAVLLPRFPVGSSWLRFGPALLLAFVTSVGLAVDDGGWRVAFVLAGATAVVAIGARARLGAPIVLGSVALLVLAIDGAAPYVASVPRWLLIGSAGAFALWAGATADRRLEQLRRWRSAIDRLA